MTISLLQQQFINERIIIQIRKRPHMPRTEKQINKMKR